MSNTSRQLLDAVYQRLGFAEGDLVFAADHPTEGASQDWLNKGDWLVLAKKVGAESIFFVENYPVVVFAIQTSDDPTDWFQWFNSVWCMARPQLLFLARDGELSVFNLTKEPARKGESPSSNRRLLEFAQVTAEVQDRLHRFRRDQVESGRLFQEEHFGSDDRADRALVRDLGRVREGLIKANLSATYAHSLIGRSIFIRYMEDRGVLTERYFRKVAKGDPEKWNGLLDHAKEAKLDSDDDRPLFYTRVLANKAFTYSLFMQLSKDFNGDMFPVNPDEQRAVTDTHLKLLRDFLLGGQGSNLFFFAYRFDIIPIDLISSIYEKFYSINPKKKRDEGSYYTPSALVDFVLAQTLTEDVLAKKPRVLDPACGSGIFLVETFRRIVRHHVAKTKKRPTPDQLRAILRDQIAGIDINAEAIRVAAFSLYLAMLHYLEPPDILHNKLPSLTYALRRRTNPKIHFDILLSEDAFSVEGSVPNESVRKRFSGACADVVVGNPPWGSPKADELSTSRSDGGVSWCKARGLSVGRKERSETFTHLTMNLLREGGRAGLLLSTGVFFKRHENVREFRRQWLGEATLRRIVNFAAVRDAFFRGVSDNDPSKPTGKRKAKKSEGAIAPFASVVFDKSPPMNASGFTYWSAKETAFVKRVQAVILNHADRRMAVQDEFADDDTLWKIYWWGGHRDEALITRLRLETTLGQLADPTGKRLGTGFQEAKKGRKLCKWLSKYREYPTDLFERYGPLPTHGFVKPPTKVLRSREPYLYEGPRLLIKEGPSSDDVQKGRIVARFETEPFCFRFSINSLPLDDFSLDDSKVLLGILWSSLTRYILFMTSGTWGLWHDAIRQETIHNIPVRIPTDSKLKTKIVQAVDGLRDIADRDDEEGTLFAKMGMTKEKRDAEILKLEKTLDEAIFKLFELTDEERDRVEELCGIGLDLFYRGMASSAVEPLDWPLNAITFGRRDEIGNGHIPENEISEYLSTFIDLWEPQLREQNGRLRWRIVRPAGASTMLAVIFQAESLSDPLDDPEETDEQAWVDILQRLAESSRQPFMTKRVYIDGLVRIVTDEDIAIIKRNERRLWTKSAARDDAEASMLMAMQINELHQE